MNVNSGTIARTVILALALVNQLLSISGHAVIPIEDQEIELLVSTSFTIVAAVINWWKNNSFTKEAIAADKYMRELKNVK